MTFSTVIGTLAQERSYAEQQAALLKHYAPDDTAGQRLYAQAKAAYDGLISEWLADLAQNHDPSTTEPFRDRLNAALAKRLAFSQHFDDRLRPTLPAGTRSTLLAALGAALAAIPAEQIKAFFDGAVALWHEWRTAAADRRTQMAESLRSERWRPYAEIPPAP